MKYEEFYQELKKILCQFGQSGKIFQNECQLQFDLAWAIKEQLKLDVKFEVVTIGDKKEYTDLAVLNDDGEFIAIELKYKTDAAVINGVSLLRHSAGDLGCYDFWHDVERLQKLYGKSISNVLEGRKCVGGIALMMTNDGWYWNKQRKHSTAQYYPFRLVDREVQDKILGWNLKAEDKEKFKQQQVNRYQDIELNLPYVLKWEEYYTDQKNCMKYLLLPVNKK